MISDVGNMLARVLLVLVAVVAADRPAAHVRPQLRTNFASHPNLVAAKPTPSAPLLDGKTQKMLLATGGALALVAPALPKLPKSAAITAVAVIVALVQMAFDVSPDQVLLETVVVLVATGVITLKEALNGFKSEGVVSVGVMCAVAKGVQCTGGLELIAKLLLGRPSGYGAALLRMLVPTIVISAFMNNTPVCAMMMPIVLDWARSLNVPAPSLLMPLSFATMLGGTLSLIGSSTNIVAAGAARNHDPSFVMNMFDISSVGLINAAAGAAYMMVAARRLLPPPTAAEEKLMDAGPPPVKAVAAAPPPRGKVRMWAALALLATTMTIASQRPDQLLVVALGCLCIFVRTGCMGLKDAWSAVRTRRGGSNPHRERRDPLSPTPAPPALPPPSPQVNGPVLLSIALSFALGQAIDKSELAAIVAKQMVSLVAPYGELALLFAIYAVAMVVGAVITNNAVVTLMFPVVVRMCEGAGVPWRPAFYALTMAASASFSTPVSYQTNMMVTGPGGYAFGDFLKFGLPLQLVCMLATVPACHLLY